MYRINQRYQLSGITTNDVRRVYIHSILDDRMKNDARTVPYYEYLVQAVDLLAFMAEASRAATLESIQRRLCRQDRFRRN